MFSSNIFKISFVVILFALLCNACSFWQSAVNQNTSNASVPFVDAELKSEFPFSTKEPDIYQTEIVVTTISSEEKMFAARNGNFRRYDFSFSGDSPISLIHDANGGKQFIDHKKKVYSEEKLSGQAFAPPAENWNDFLTADLINQKKNVRFEKIDAENNLTKYRVILNETNADGSETVISIDEKLGFPVKSEFYGIEGEQKTLKFSVEMKNIKLQTEDNLFQIPAGYRKVSLEEFRAMMDKGNLNEK